MKFFVVFAAIVAAAAAAPCANCGDHGSVRVTQDTAGNYELGYDIGSISRSETRDGHDGSVHGSYSYHDNDGILRSVSYTSGINGFQVTGSHLPVPVVDVPEVAFARSNHLALLGGPVALPLVHHVQPVAQHLIAPLPVQETPEVAFARAEHFRAHALAGHPF